MNELKCPKCDANLLKRDSIYREVTEDLYLSYNKEHNYFEECDPIITGLEKCRCSNCDTKIHDFILDNNIAIKAGIENCL